MKFAKQEYWSGLPFPSPGDLPNPGIKLTSPALAGGFFTTEQREAHETVDTRMLGMVLSLNESLPDLLSVISVSGEEGLD